MRSAILDTRRDIATTSARADIQVVEGGGPDAILPALLEFAAREPTWLVATSDDWLRFLVTHRLVVSHAFDKVLNPANDVLAICLHKAAFTRWCESNALPTPT